VTKVIVKSGACGYTVTITAEKGADQKIAVSLDTDCEMVKKMLEDIAVVERFAALRGFMSNPVYRSAATHIKHVACVVPSAVLKALEVEAGLNVATDVTITFEDKEE
jgi:pentose-5-phosphate-3-epimerase